jgi:hypothetical protein
MRVELFWRLHLLERMVVPLDLVVAMHQEELRVQVPQVQTVEPEEMVRSRMLLVSQV